LKSAIELLQAGTYQLGVNKGFKLIDEFISTYGDYCKI